MYGIPLLELSKGGKMDLTNSFPLKPCMLLFSYKFSNNEEKKDCFIVSFEKFYTFFNKYEVNGK